MPPSNTIHDAANRVSAFDQDGRLVGAASAVQCPTCQIALEIGEVHENQFAGCPSCGGMLMQLQAFSKTLSDRRSVQTAFRDHASPMNPQELRVRKNCPACWETMETYPYAGPGNAVIDSCSSCGIVWLDRGELTQLVTAPGRR